MKISFEGIGEKLVTFMGKDVKAGDPVKVSGAGTVSPCSAGERFNGFAACVNGEYVGVIISGAVTSPYSDRAPDFGPVELCADGNGGVKASGSGMPCLVVDLDEAEQTVTFIM